MHRNKIKRGNSSANTPKSVTQDTNFPNADEKSFQHRKSTFEECAMDPWFFGHLTGKTVMVGTTLHYNFFIFSVTVT